MASRNQIEQQKLDLLERLNESRKTVLGAKLLLDEQVANKKSSLTDALNVPKRVKNSFTQKPAKSFGIALVSGLGASILMKLSSKRKKAKLQQMHLLKPAKQTMLAGLTIAMLKPFVQKLVLQYTQQWLAQRAESKTSPQPKRLHDKPR